MLSVMGTPARAESDAELARQWQYAWNCYKFGQVADPLPVGRARKSQSISIVINAPRAGVFKAYSDFENHIGANPFLERVVTHSDKTKHGVRTKNLTAIEVIPIEPDPITLTTHAQQRLDLSNYFYEVDSWSTGNIVTHQKIVFESLGGSVTRVTEHLTFETTLELIDFTLSQGVLAHQGIQQGLKQRIESGAL
ncbi:SRPBCC family protein [Acrocarpospora catenulata]|uniref:SRPBCC family protein n=1 Tax=Acrocarpospora catenulata TaxID=2836182 RepID=UPI0027E1E6FA|nr:SRPBCC family protein [Acrocarpospora catenulata]